MHFTYLDETGCDGSSLVNPQKPIFVLGGITVKDQGWARTTKKFTKILCDYFEISKLPPDFELHANELLSPNGEGSFLGHDRDRRNQLAFDILELIIERSHQIQYFALKKSTLERQSSGDETSLFNPKIPYLLAFNYLVTYIEAYCKNHLGHTARGMIIIDIKDQFLSQIETISHYRRFLSPQNQRLKWLVEFTYPVDSKHHPMIQISDLVIFCVRKFFEMDCGYCPNWPSEANNFYKQCFEKIYPRTWRKTALEQIGRKNGAINDLNKLCLLKPSRGWENN